MGAAPGPQPARQQQIHPGGPAARPHPGA
jgi:hypothetical protein